MDEFMRVGVSFHLDVFKAGAKRPGFPAAWLARAVALSCGKDKLRLGFLPAGRNAAKLAVV
jgi:hypothetical protein